MFLVIALQLAWVNILCEPYIGKIPQDGNFGQNVSLFRCRSISSTNPGQISNLTTQSLHLMCLVQIMTAEDKGILGVGWPCHQFCPLSVFCKSELLQRCISAAMAPSSCVDNRLRGTKIMTQIIYEIFFLLSMFVHGQKIFMKKKPQPAKLLVWFPHYRVKNQKGWLPITKLNNIGWENYDPGLLLVDWFYWHVGHWGSLV